MKGLAKAGVAEGVVGPEVGRALATVTQVGDPGRIEALRRGHMEESSHQGLRRDVRVGADEDRRACGE
jgi:hypothetical protein